MLDSVDPEYVALGVAAFVTFMLNRFRGFFVLSVKGNLLWTGFLTFLSVDLFLRRDEAFMGVENTVWLAACVVITAGLILFPDLIPALLRRIRL